MSKTLVVLLGPTGVGKTELSLRLAEYYHSPILSSDSRQLYRELTIGTAAPTQEQMGRIQHYFVGTLDLHEYYSAARYEEDVIKLLDKLFLSHNVILMSGGSMMYIDAVCKGIDEIPTISDEIRHYTVEKYNSEGLDCICRELKKLDPIYYEQVDLKNPKRVIHALEICYMTGRPYSELRTNQAKERNFNIIKIGLIRERKELFSRINTRVDEMVAKGLIEEARRVYTYKDYNSLNTVGYKEMFKYLSGEWSLEQATEKIKRNTRVYAKKQITWFKKDDTIRWFHPEEEKAIIEYIEQKI
ncbi:tRNA (adenosine(37)-N6)-dimethylallyltransferase MiaA [Coprobacter secundus]|uniref:tRNA (adenosine(37)-N6)-dimethylallyltransferase MiaA n=1 Tax=Coprobacter secundus TaxID=1501392 RepID=UPI00351FD2EC